MREQKEAGESLPHDSGRAFEGADCGGEQLCQGAVGERWLLGASLWGFMKPQGRAEHH